MVRESAPYSDAVGEPRRGALAWWHRTPLYVRILGGMALGVLAGHLLGGRAIGLRLPSELILRLLGALAPMLILIAVIRAVMTAEISGRVAGRLVGLLVLNTVVAIVIGLVVANVIRPGRGAKLRLPSPASVVPASADPLAPRVLGILKEQGVNVPTGQPAGPMEHFLENIPKSLLEPLTVEGKVIGVILIAVASGLVLRRARARPIATVEDLVNLAFDSLLVALHWVIDLVPIGVFGIVASIVGREGFRPFASLGMFIGSVLLALLLQAAYYLARIRLLSWVRPIRLLRGTRDALVMAFSTGSSTVTMPVTYECLRDRVGLREESASLGALVGSNFNNDGTALYEAMAALFVAQMLGSSLTVPQQLLVVLTSVVASVGAAGIPEAGLVTMTLVFRAVGLPIEYIALLLTVDWFLDRCRTTINVMGDMNVACLLDGRTPDARTGRHASPERGPAPDAAPCLAS